MRRIYHQILTDEAEGNEEEEKRLQQLEQGIIALNGKSDNLLDELNQINKVTIPEKKENINELRAEVERIKAGGKVEGGELGLESVDKLGYYMGISILVALTAYLIIFYTSVIYSAFIFDVMQALQEGADADKLYLPTIINLKAIPLTHAEHGFLGSVFLVVGAFMFIALGYLIHKFSEGKRYFAAAALLLFTLLFDILLAGDIVYNILEAKYFIGEIPDEPDLQSLFRQVSFYIIIAAGFAIYIIWGLVLSFIMEERKKMKPEKIALREKSTLIKFLNEEIEKLNAKAQELKAQLKTTEKEIESKEKEKRTIFFNKQEISKKINAFGTGWIRFISQAYEDGEANTKIKEAQQVIESFINNLQAKPSVN